MCDIYDDDGDDSSFGSELELPERSVGEDREESGGEEDEVQITHDPQLSKQMVSLSSNARTSNHRKITYVMRRKTMSEVVQIPRIIPRSDEWRTCWQADLAACFSLLLN